jgi:hypothetical protein
VSENEVTEQRAQGIMHLVKNFKKQSQEIGEGAAAYHHEGIN